ncbi:hypothetical protein SPRG_10482 [Saprolegnia parasitica CBS 223.65]|uniref:Uncharacterized protein n=1 Tax=Saprolegnia parasitica (strain CBS 223.65) TaxID=695850 RepID=A0A067BYY7_SAPPC|nr:hypothetical protein SPRG_10482 [Saprolegnia parasitica CBS 223.65]KDO23704.1 hypothetical protein SPRG_10482 [Saprolegnia parasitica CBS 223.65]|eukprot:XP_012205522.1 hypothetical protein SPRG_10482 [Saprolegnia parasitica CBS 223.65]
MCPSRPRNVQEATSLEEKTTKLAPLDTEPPMTPRLLYHSSYSKPTRGSSARCTRRRQPESGPYQGYLLVCINEDLHKARPKPAVPPTPVNGDLVDAMMVDETTKCATEVNVLLQKSAGVAIERQAAAAHAEKAQCALTTYHGCTTSSHATIRGRCPGWTVSTMVLTPPP